MKNRFRLVKRGCRGSTFYAFDTLSKKRISLQTQDPEEAARLINAKNDGCNQPAVNLQLARVYIQQSDPEMANRTWQHAFDEFVARSGQESTRTRRERAIRSQPFDLIREKKILQTTADALRERDQERRGFH